MTAHLDEFKTRVRATWDAGDYATLSERIAEVGEPQRVTGRLPGRFAGEGEVVVDGISHDTVAAREDVGYSRSVVEGSAWPRRSWASRILPRETRNVATL